MFHNTQNLFFKKKSFNLKKIIKNYLRNFDFCYFFDQNPLCRIFTFVFIQDLKRLSFKLINSVLYLKFAHFFHAIEF